VFAVGDHGTILHSSNGGFTWTPQDSPTGVFLLDVWGTSVSNVFAVGVGGAILHYNGSSWTSQSSGTAFTLRSIWGSSGSSILAVGDGGTVLRYNGTSWTAQTSVTTNDLHGVWKDGCNAFAVGNSGTILDLGNC
jgi:photosystem II stability/assembly factor-like uncharacterized protein